MSFGHSEKKGPEKTNSGSRTLVRAPWSRREMKVPCLGMAAVHLGRRGQSEKKVEAEWTGLADGRVWVRDAGMRAGAAFLH